MAGAVISWVLTAYLVILLVRWVLELVQAISRSFRPTGPWLVVCETVFTVTDPPLKLLRRIIPPLRLGGVGLDLSFLLLFIVIVVLRQYAQAL